MIKGMRLRFWLEAGMSALTGVLFVITLLWRDWIEGIFGFDLDNHNGSIEWMIVVVLLVITVVLFLLARTEWRISRNAIREHSE